MAAHVGRTLADSYPQFSERLHAPAGSPNVVLIVLDDMGFADLGCFGSRILTPHIDALARGGLRYNNFHATALCSPTRACLMTGRNHHAVGMGLLAGYSIGFPGYSGRIPRSAAMLPRVLRSAGYNTFAVGKWHLTPAADTGAAGPFDLWPLGVGFERYYGFLGWGSDQWRPSLTRDNTHLAVTDLPAEGYHLTEDLATQAIRLVSDQQGTDPTKPFFLYFATAAPHSPHQVPREWADRYRGRFDDGWDAAREETFERQRSLGVVPSDTMLTPRPSWVAPWSALSSDERRVYSRMMEVYAGFLSHADAQIGALLEALSARGILDNTLVMLMSDNGASAEGGPHGYLDHRVTDDVASMLEQLDELGGRRSFSHYAWGWAWAGNTPFRLWKRYSWLGGVRVPFIVHWPAHMPVDVRGRVRRQFCHAVDAMPTILEAAHVEAPDTVDGAAQMPLHGRSFLSTFVDDSAPSPRSRQYFETLGSRAIYQDGWKAVTDHVVDWPIERQLMSGSRDFDEDRWSLFHLDKDFAEATDVADAHADRLRSMTELWWAEAGRNDVLPLLEGGYASPAREPHPYRDEYLHLPGTGEITTPSPFRGFDLTVDIEVADGRTAASGVICAHHNSMHPRIRVPGGWAMYVSDGRVRITFNIGRGQQRVVEAPISLSGMHELRISCHRTSGRGTEPELTVALSLDGRTLGAGRVPLGDWEALAGRNPSFAGQLVFGDDDEVAPVLDAYRAYSAFTGTIRRARYLVAPMGDAVRPIEPDLRSD